MAGSPLPEYVEVGRVRRPHGVHGGLVVEPLSNVPGRFAPGTELVLVSADGRRQPVEVARSAPHGRRLLVSLVGYEDRDAVEPLRGAVLEVSRAATPSAPEGAFYYFELVGCECADLDRGGLGTVSDVIEDGGGLLLEVSDGARTLLVPFVRSFIRSVDIAGRRIELELPEGLIDSCAST